MIPVFWALPTSFLTGAGAAAGIALVAAIGNLGGFAGPAFTGASEDSTGGFEMPLVVLSCLLLVAALLTLLAREETACRGPGAGGGARGRSGQSERPGGYRTSGAPEHAALPRRSRGSARRRPSVRPKAWSTRSRPTRRSTRLSSRGCVQVEVVEALEVCNRRALRVPAQDRHRESSSSSRSSVRAARRPSWRGSSSRRSTRRGTAGWRAMRGLVDATLVQQATNPPGLTRSAGAGERALAVGDGDRAPPGSQPPA